MKVVKKTGDYTIYEKRSKRYAVKSANKKWLNGDDKVKGLLEEGLVKIAVAAPVAAEPEAAEETGAGAEEAAEAPAETSGETSAE